MATPTVYVICDQNCKYESLTREQIYTAITQAIKDGTISDVDAGFITTIKTINNVAARFFIGTQAAYNDLEDADKENLFKIITDDTTIDGLNEAIETLNTEFEEYQTKLQKGYITVKRAEKAQCDENGLNIAENYLLKENAPIILSSTTQNKAITKGYDGKVFIEQDADLTLEQIQNVSFEIKDSNGVIYTYFGMKSSDVQTDTNGSFVRFNCILSVYEETPSTLAGVPFMGTANIKIYKQRNAFYFVMELARGLFVYSDTAIVGGADGKANWSYANLITSDHLLQKVYLYFTNPER